MNISHPLSPVSLVYAQDFEASIYPAEKEEMCVHVAANFGGTESTFCCKHSASPSMVHTGWLTVPKLARFSLRYPSYAEEHGAHVSPSQ